MISVDNLQLPSNWTPERKREYARERYKRLKALAASKKKGAETKGSKRMKSGSVARRPKITTPRVEASGVPSHVVPDSTRIELTGNPFVDTGLAVIASKCGLDSIEDLSLGHLRRLHGDGLNLARRCEPLKCFTMIFTTNSLLRQPSIKDRERRIQMHAAITAELLNSIGSETESEHCEACGNPNSADLAAIANRALSKLGEEPQDRFIGRDWFPMAGSLGSDAQALPAGSRSPALCARCLLAVQYLPLGVRLFGRDLAVFQSTSTRFWYGLVGDIEKQIERQAHAGSNAILGSKQGKAGLAIQLLDYFKELQQQKKDSGLDEDTKLYVWRFTNSTAPNLEIDEIPSHALVFLHRAAKQGLGPEITRIIKTERTYEDNTFFACITAKKDYYGLYPGKIGKEKSYPGASHELFLLYQTHILGRSIQSIKAAYEVAKAALEEQRTWNAHPEEKKAKDKAQRTDREIPKELERLTRREAFDEMSVRSRYRKIMAQLARSGRFDLKSYHQIFPLKGDGTVSVSGKGWDVIRYYTGAIVRQHELSFDDEQVAALSPPTDALMDSQEGSRVAQLLQDTARAIFSKCIESRGPEKFENDILHNIERGKLGVQWLRAQFIKLSKIEDCFNGVTWSNLCHPMWAKWTLNELFFEYRLLWSEWLSRPPIHKDQGTPSLRAFERPIQREMELSGIPTIIARSLVDELKAYAAERGWDRVERDILARLQRGELGISWFASRLVHRPDSTVSEQEFDAFLRDFEGRLQISEKTFLMSLFLSNAYRVLKDSPMQLLLS